MQSPDFGRTALDYAAYRAPFPPELFERLIGLGVGRKGQRVLDIGTGTGMLAREFARAGCDVTGLDPSPELVEEARKLDSQAGVSVSYVQGVAEDTRLADSAFEAVTAAVCWHWFDGDQAAREIRRILVPGGALAIVHFDWLATPGSVAADSMELIQRSLPSRPVRSLARDAFYFVARRVKAEWVGAEGTGIHPDRLATLARNGFERLESFSFDVGIEYSHQAWRGRLRSHASLGASKSPEIVARADEALAEMLRAHHPSDPLEVMHRIFVVVGRAPA